jgi:Zn-dependent protease with chaperone function
VDQWDRGPGTLLKALFVVVLVLASAYWLALPFVVRGLASQVPEAALETLGTEVLASLDQQTLQATALPSSQRELILAGFGRLPLPQDLTGRARLEFRKSDAIGANALALPSGHIVVTDALVLLAKDTDDVVAVLAHEVGHLEGRHGIRSVVRGALVATLATLVIGDISGLAAIAAPALLNARYSRDLEREADAYAAAALRQMGVSPTRLADMLERMESQQADAGRESPTGAFAYLSTHPPTAERLESLRAHRD